MFQAASLVLSLGISIIAADQPALLGYTRPNRPVGTVLNQRVCRSSNGCCLNVLFPEWVKEVKEYIMDFDELMDDSPPVESLDAERDAINPMTRASFYCGDARWPFGHPPQLTGSPSGQIQALKVGPFTLLCDTYLKTYTDPNGNFPDALKAVCLDEIPEEELPKRDEETMDDIERMFQCVDFQPKRSMFANFRSNMQGVTVRGLLTAMKSDLQTVNWPSTSKSKGKGD